MTAYCSKCQQPLTKVGPDNYLCPTHPDARPTAAPQIVAKGGGYYDVYVAGIKVNNITLRGEDAAQRFADRLS